MKPASCSTSCRQGFALKVHERERLLAGEIWRAFDQRFGNGSGADHRRRLFRWSASRESARMTWDMVDFKRKHIDLPAEIAKAGERRIVDMPDNLVQWLRPCRKESGALQPVNFRRKRWALCREMTWKEWPDDILRHSYGSYHLAKHRSAGRSDRKG